MYTGLAPSVSWSATGLDFPGEPKGMTREASAWTDADKATIAFGQGFAVSGIQLITAFNALVNGGIVMRPTYQTHHRCQGHHLTRRSGPQAGERLSQSGLGSDCRHHEISNSQGGTAETACMHTFQVFGKTGTAQKIDPLTGAYSEGNYVSSFIGGIIDATGKTRLTMIVCINEPRPFYYASLVACPLFKEIVSQCASIMELSPNITLATRGNSG